MNQQQTILFKFKTIIMSKNAKNAENGKNPMKVVGGAARISYAHVFKPTSVHPDKPETLKYSVVLLIPKDNKALVAQLKKAIEAAKELGAETKWKNTKKVANLKLPLRDGDLEDKPEYEGHWFISAKSDTKPGIVDKDMNPLTTEDEFYSGCFARFSIKFYPFNTAGNIGVGTQLYHLQKVKDGERLGGRASADEDFSEEWADDDDELM